MPIPASADAVCARGARQPQWPGRRDGAECAGAANPAERGDSLRIGLKPPGSAIRLQPDDLGFHYGEEFGAAAPEAYERLLLDAILGDATLFIRRDEVEAAWSLVTPTR